MIKEVLMVVVMISSSGSSSMTSIETTRIACEKAKGTLTKWAENRSYYTYTVDCFDLIK